MKCVKCDSEKIIPQARLLDIGDYSTQHDARVQVQTDPHAFMFKGSVNVKLEARICGSCGYVELFAEFPETLWLAYLRQQQNKAQ